MPYQLPGYLRQAERIIPGRSARLRQQVLNVGSFAVFLVRMGASIALLLIMLEIELHPVLFSLLVGGTSLLIIFIGIRNVR